MCYNITRIWLNNTILEIVSNFKSSPYMQNIEEKSYTLTNFDQKVLIVSQTKKKVLYNLLSFNTYRCTKVYGYLMPGETRDFYCSRPLHGRYVFIISNTENKVLTLCEVQIFTVEGKGQAVDSISVLPIRLLTKIFIRSSLLILFRSTIVMSGLWLNPRGALSY